MAGCFVLKDGAGRTQGYVQQLQCVIRYVFRAEAGSDGYRLVLLFSDESIDDQEIVCNGEEKELLMQEEKKLIGGCIVSRDVVVAATDRRAKRFVQERFLPINRIDQGRREESVLKPIEHSRESKPAQFVRRWPPNPCCPLM